MAKECLDLADEYFRNAIAWAKQAEKVTQTFGLELEQIPPRPKLPEGFDPSVWYPVIVVPQVDASSTNMALKALGIDVPPLREKKVEVNNFNGEAPYATFVSVSNTPFFDEKEGMVRAATIFELGAYMSQHKKNFGENEPRILAYGTTRNGHPLFIGGDSTGFNWFGESVFKGVGTSADLTLLALSPNRLQK